jgi:flagellar hook-basal body complex protein FliE
MPIEAITAAGVGGPEWNIALPEAPEVTQLDGAEGVAGDSKGFGGMLADQIGNLQDLQTNAADQSQALAAGTATDTASVVMAVEKAQLAMQLAANLRDKGVTAIQEIFRTQV